MKKALIIIGSIFVFLLLTLIAIPYFFKDKILARIDQEIAGSVNAEVYYNYDNVSLSLLRRFPNISATVREFGIKGNPPFHNDTLMHINSLQVDLNLRSVLFDDYPELKGVHLLGGSIYIRVLEDGTANYDIAMATDETIPQEPSEFRLGVEFLEVKDVNLVYNDSQLDFFMALANLDMEGRGDFTLDVYDLLAEARADIVRMDYEGVNYLRNKRFRADTRMEVDMEQMRFTFQDGDFALNEFNFGMDGFLAMPAEAVELDLSFSGRDNDFKSILSLVPGIYDDAFSGLRTSGTMDFRGFVKGAYDENSIPSFEVALRVNDGMFQYPDLPRPVSDVNIDMLIQNHTADIENTRINIPTFDLNFGNNPVSGRLLVENLRTYDMDGQLKGSLNLEELTSIFPLEGMELRGNLAVDAAAKGRYDSVANIIPAINADLALRNGFVRSAEYPAPIENLNVSAKIVNTTGNMNDLLVDVSTFGFVLEGESIQGNMKVNDLRQLNWDGSLHGVVDLGKMAAIFPLENVIMEGRIRADIDTKGSYADVEANRYDRMRTEGDIEVMDLYYTDLEFPQGIRIKNARADFSPDRINLSNFDARLGQSPVSATGHLSNYIAYLVGENQTLSGQLDIQSSRFDVNEWMTGGTEETASTELAVIELPRNVDFNMSIVADEVLYDNLILRNARGRMGLKDAILRFEDVSTGTLGGQVSFNGVYNAQDLKLPGFDMSFKVNGVSIQEAFRALNTVQVFAPVAQHLTGDFSTDFAMKGILGPDMMPVLSSLDGRGLIKVVQAAFEDSRLLQGITTLTKLKETQTITFRDVVLSARIEDGRMLVSPFTVRLWDYETTVEGSTGFDGSINYLLNMNVPAGRFGAQANQLLGAVTGTGATASTVIPLAINIGGSYQNPRFNLAGGMSIETLLTQALRSRADAERDKVQDQLQRAQADVVEQFRAKEDSLKTDLKQKADVARDSVRREADRAVDEAKSRAAEEAKNVIRRGLGGFLPAKRDTMR